MKISWSFQPIRIQIRPLVKLVNLSSKHLFQEGLLYLAHSASSVDGVNHIAEKQAIKKIIEHERIPEDLHSEVDRIAKSSAEKEIYRKGMTCFLQIPKEERLRALAWLYKLIEADGMVHIKEARWMLYVINAADVDLDEILECADELPDIKDEQLK